MGEVDLHAFMIASAWHGLALCRSTADLFGGFAYALLLKVRRQLRAITVPILDGSILGFKKSQKAAVGTVPEMMAACFYGVAYFDVIGRDSYFLKLGAAG
jgi:hypothetical protein